MEPAELHRIQREVGALMHGLLVHLTQQDGRPITAATLQHVRDFGLQCYLQGIHASARMQTLPAPAFPPAKD